MSRYTFEFLKKIFNDINSEEDFLRHAGILAEIHNKFYFDREDANYDRPGIMINVNPGDKLIVKNDRIMVSTSRYEHYGIYERGNEFYLLLDSNNYHFDYEMKSERFMEQLGFSFKEHVAIAFERIIPCHKIESLPKTPDQRGTTSFSVERYERPLGAIWYNPESEKQFPKICIYANGVEFHRLNETDEWRVKLNTNFFKDIHLTSTCEENKALLKSEIRLHFKNFKNPLVEKEEVHEESLTIGGTREPRIIVSNYHLGNREEIEADLDRIRNWAKRTSKKKEVGH